MILQRLRARIDARVTHGRSRRLALGVATGVFTKAFSFALTLFIVPLTLHHLGPERYGLWVTMFSLIAWLGLMDIGIANGLTPALSAAFGNKRDDLAREYVATAFWALAVIACIVAVLAAVAWSFVDWHRLFNTSSAEVAEEAAAALAVAGSFFLLSLPLSINQRVLLAYQEGAIANACQLIVGLSGALGIYLATRIGGGLSALVVGFSGMQFLTTLAVSLWLFCVHKPFLQPVSRPRWSEARHVLGLGGLFFVLQLATLLVFQKDNILITYLIGPGAAASYAVAWQMFFYVNALMLVVSPYLAPGFGEAFAKGDIKWVSTSFKRYLMASLGIAVPMVLLMVLMNSHITKLWVGEIVKVPRAVVIWLGAWTLILAALSPVVALLIGVGRLRRYTAFTLLASVVSLIGSIIFIPRFGAAGSAMASVTAYTIFVLLPAFFEVRTVLRDGAVRIQENGLVENLRA